MKKQHLILTVLLGVFALFSCEKDSVENFQPAPQPESEDLAIQREVDAVLAGLSDTIALGGLDFSDEEAYRALPEARPELMQRLTPENLVEQRDAWRYIAAPPVADQGREGSCVSFAAGYGVVSYYLRAIHGLPYTPGGALRSPEFLYNISKSPGDCEAGTIFESAFYRLRYTGVCSWAEMPYTDHGCSTRPNAYQIARAAAGRIAGWQSVPKHADYLRALLDKGYPIVAGFTIDDWFAYQTKYPPFVWNRTGGRQHGGHAVTIIGYNDEYRVFLVQNSWGRAAHDNGYFYMSYDLAPEMDRLYVLEPVF